MLDGPRALMRGRTTILDHALAAARPQRPTASSTLDGGRDRRPRPRARPGAAAARAAARPRGDGARCSRARCGERRARRRRGRARRLQAGRAVAVHYARVDGAADAVATRIAGVDLAARARQPRYADRGAADRALARAARSLRRRRSTRSSPGCRSTRGCPRSPSTGRARAPAGRRRSTGEPALVGYKPRARAVLRRGRARAQGLRRERAVRRGAGRACAPQRGPLRTAAFAAALPELRLTVQRRVAARRRRRRPTSPPRPARWPPTLQRAALDDLPAAPPERQLAAARGKADGDRGRAARAARPRSTRSCAGSRDALPAGARARARARRLPRRPAARARRRRSRSSTSTSCASRRRRSTSRPTPPTSCAAATATARRSRPCSSRCSSGYGARPDALDWHLAAAILGRAAHPFHRQVPGWPERIEAMVARGGGDACG